MMKNELQDMNNEELPRISTNIVNDKKNNIDGNRDHIEQGEDEKGKYYKVYYNTEE